MLLFCILPRRPHGFDPPPAIAYSIATLAKEKMQ
jgi:hypothetical protein